MRSRAAALRTLAYAGWVHRHPAMGPESSGRCHQWRQVREIAVGMPHAKGDTMTSAFAPSLPTSGSAPLLPRLLPLVDPDCFHDVGFFQELSAIGYRQILLGGTGSVALPQLARDIRQHTKLSLVVYPMGPQAVSDDADLIIMPDVMNSGAAHARPFGPAAVATASAIARICAPFLPVAYFIQSDSTACRYFEASPIRCGASLIDHCRYAQMVGYQHIAFDYEGPESVDVLALAAVKQALPRCRLTVSDEVSPAGVRDLWAHGVDTVVIPSDLWETANDPVELAYEYYVEMLAC